MKRIFYKDNIYSHAYAIQHYEFYADLKTALQLRNCFLIDIYSRTTFFTEVMAEFDLVELFTLNEMTISDITTAQSVYIAENNVISLKINNKYHKYYFKKKDEKVEWLSVKNGESSPYVTSDTTINIHIYRDCVYIKPLKVNKIIPRMYFKRCQLQWFVLGLKEFEPKRQISILINNSKYSPIEFAYKNPGILPPSFAVFYILTSTIDNIKISMLDDKYINVGSIDIILEKR